MNTMDTLLDSTFPFLRWLFENSVKAALLACVVGMTCLLMRRWIAPGWRHALWCAVFVRLILPDVPVPGWRWNVSEVVAASSMIRSSDPVAAQAQPLERASEVADSSVEPQTASRPFLGTGRGEGTKLPAYMSRGTTEIAASLPLTWWQILVIVWLSGTAAWWAALCIGWWRFRRDVLCKSTEATTESRAILASCLAETGIRAHLALRTSRRIGTPAVCGMFRHVILLPHGLESSISVGELRLLLLHELGHVKRRDSALQVLASVLLGLHWWNPFAWLAWHQLRNEAEAATDAWVLRRTDAKSAPSYGAMLLTLASRACASGVALLLVPTLIGATSRGRRLKRRMRDIAAPGVFGRRAAAPGILLMGCLVVAGFSQEAAKKSPAAETKPGTESAANDTIGGVVSDEAGQPVVGAKIEFELKPPRGRVAKPALPPGYKEPDPVQTDDAGRWQISGVPEGLVPYGAGMGGATYSLHVTHPDFLYRSIAASSGDAASFRQGTAKLELKRGLRLQGVVRDEVGQPIAGATIQHNLTTTNRGLSEATTDAGGHYELNSARKGEFAVRVRAKGFATQLQQVTVAGETNQDFTLKKAQTLTLRIQDDKDQPAAGASLVIFPPGQGWKAGDRLWSVDECPSNGLVVWEEAPAGELVAEIRGFGFKQITQKISSGGEVLVKLPAENRLPSITINVTDAATGAPLSGCGFETGVVYVPSSASTSWSTSEKMWVPMTRGSADGEYKGIVPEGFQNRGLKLCVRHEGYIPLITPRVELTQEGSTLSVAMQKGEPFELTVVDAKGAAVSGAKVYVMWLTSIQLREFSISPGSLSVLQMEFSGATGADGRCELPPCAPTASILVTHESGFAVAPLADVTRSPTMKLGLYAQVEATVTKNGKPAPGVKYEFHGGMDLPGGVGFGFNVLQSFPVVSDEQGRIALPRVLPTKIGRFQEPAPLVQPGQTRAFSTPVKSQPVPVGQVTTFELEVKESRARNLTGRFVVEGTGMPAGSRHAPVSLRLNQPSTSGYSRISAMGNLDEKGRFTFVGVAPGEYTLQISAITGESARYAFPRGQTELKVSVPEASAEAVGKSVDLGDIEVVDTQK